MSKLFGGLHRPWGRRTRYAVVVAAGAAALAVGGPYANATSPYPTSPVAPATSTTAVTPVKPATPVLSVRSDGTSAQSSHLSVPLTVANVRANAGSVTSVKIKYGPNSSFGYIYEDDLTVVPGRTVYPDTAAGRGDLRVSEYLFMAEVCNSTGACASSSSLVAVPFVTAVAPGTPVLGIYQPGSSAAGGSDRQAPLILGAIHPGSGAVASVKIYSGPASGSSLPYTDSVPVSSGQWQLKDNVGETTYYVQAKGGGHLQNGSQYQFVAEVCNTAHLCTRSTPILFTPYGTPQAPKPVGTSLGGLSYQVSWGAVNLNGYSSGVKCRVSVTDVASGAEVASAVPDPGRAGSLTGTATGGHSYKALYYCSWAGGRGGVGAYSDPFTVQ